MWQQPLLHRNNVVPEDEICNQPSLATSSSQVSLSFASQRSLARSQSVGSANHQSANGRHRSSVGMLRNETFRLGPYFAPQRSNGSSSSSANVPSASELQQAVTSAVAAAVHPPPPPIAASPHTSSPNLRHMTHLEMAVLENSVRSLVSSSSSLLASHLLVRPPPPSHSQQSLPHSQTATAASSTRASSGCESPLSSTHYSDDDSSVLRGNYHHHPSSSKEEHMLIQTSPSELYRLIASHPHSTPPNWDIILQRAISHPQEACFFDPNAGGHVYALHRLLRRTGGRDGDGEDGGEEEGRDAAGPPYAVVEAIMTACPRAVTRKQAVIDEDNDFMDEGGSHDGDQQEEEGSIGSDQQQQQPHPQQQHPNQVVLNMDGLNDLNHQQQQQQQQQQPPNEDEEDNESDASSQSDHQQNQNNDNNHDDVRFEYPLAIACECNQDGEIIRLIASAVRKTKPVYRSEVFRSLDYASLSNSVVRILLEEYASLVLERGTVSEANEGEDDDCPLEKVLFDWDDPDCLGMEEEIAIYPECDMKEDLQDLWEKLRMMMYAATKGSMEGYDNCKESFQVLHHLLRIVSKGGIQDVRFPSDFQHSMLLLAKFIQRENVDMFRERDENGSLPLHIAVSERGLLRDVEPRLEDHEGEGGEDNREAMDEVVEEAGQLDGQQGPLPPAVDDAPMPQRDAQPMPEANESDEEDEDEEEQGEEESEHGVDGPSSYGMEIIRLLLDQYPASIRLRDLQTGSLPIHLALQRNPHATDAIDHFLDIYPRSVTMPDGEGRLPIHLALLNSSPSWEKILALSPTSLEARDPVTSLLPFQLAALPNSHGEETADGAEQELDSLTTCFCLLRMSPCLAAGLAEVKPRPQSLIEQQIMTRYKPRVTKLEEENERLRQKVLELEKQLLQMQMNTPEGHAMKKRKSSSTFNGLH